MISVDTSFLIDLWRSSSRPDAPCVRLLQSMPGELFVVPAHAAGEFLEGGAVVSEVRFNESLRFVRVFAIGDVGIETASHYAKAVADLRSKSLLKGMSKPDLWIAAWALEHGCPLVTRNPRHFGPVAGLDVISYAQ